MALRDSKKTCRPYAFPSSARTTGISQQIKSHLGYGKYNKPSASVLTRSVVTWIFVMFQQTALLSLIPKQFQQCGPFYVISSSWEKKWRRINNKSPIFYNSIMIKLWQKSRTKFRKKTIDMMETVHFLLLLNNNNNKTSRKLKRRKSLCHIIFVVRRIRWTKVVSIPSVKMVTIEDCQDTGHFRHEALLLFFSFSAAISAVRSIKMPTSARFHVYDAAQKQQQTNKINVVDFLCLKKQNFATSPRKRNHI